MKLKNLFFLLLASGLSAQTSFNYQRDWATYFGAVNTAFTKIYEDASSDIFVDAKINSPNPSLGTVPVSYYNQFVSPGSPSYTGSYSVPDNFSGKFTSGGSLLYAGYSPSVTPLSLAKFPVYRDRNGNRYEMQRGLASYPGLPSGPWLINAPESENILFTKYDGSNTVLWQTYLPGNSSFDTMEVDENGNIYVAGLTRWQNLADAGTFQPAFSTVYDAAGIALSNSYLVKLNPQGQKIWATYTPSASINGMTVFGSHLYIFGNKDLNPAGADLSTPGTFQPAKASQFIAQIDANTGQRTWGTYYGIPGNGGGAGLSDIKADGTGVYVTGMTFGIPGTYFASEGAYRPQTTDGFDLFITKFSLSGGRVWSTYIGTDGMEMYSGDRGLDVKNGKLLFTGVSSGNQNIATSGAYISAKPNPDSEDLFFGILNTDTGFPDFISYYGGNGPTFSGSSIQCAFSNDPGGFFLYGNTDRTVGYSSSNGYQQNIIYPGGMTTGTSSFIAKFSSSFLSASETDRVDDLVLYNNPNNGNFSLKGSVLQKRPHFITLYDMSGKLIYSRNTQKNKEEYFMLGDLLSNGSYILSVRSGNQALIKTFKLTVKK